MPLQKRFRNQTVGSGSVKIREGTPLLSCHFLSPFFLARSRQKNGNLSVKCFYVFGGLRELRRKRSVHTLTGAEDVHAVENHDKDAHHQHHHAKAHTGRNVAVLRAASVLVLVRIHVLNLAVKADVDRQVVRRVDKR